MFNLRDMDPHGRRIALVYDGRKWNKIHCICLGIAEYKHWYEACTLVVPKGPILVPPVMDYDQRMSLCYDFKNNKMFHAVHFVCCENPKCFNLQWHGWLKTKVAFPFFRYVQCAFHE